MPEQSNDYRVVVFGAGGVGKTSLVLRFINGTFRNSYIPTIEDTYRKVISSNKSICTLQITDTTGSHQFPAMQRLSISKGHAFILVYSISSRQSLEELRTILELVNEVKGDLDGFPIMLVGNKSDEEAGKREVSQKTGEALQQMWKCKYIETSAKNDTNVTELFEELLKLETSRQLSLQPIEETESKGGVQKMKEKCVLM
ncbi:DIRAS2 [Lepeophtheirus salmonis]|uniref:DIRAS family, GTPbinding RASlike 2 [Felis catus] n=1 Tax=Lepeophtheirus salmonis TaxID=72036 RepID=A0A0K2TJR1_LEPSM|nr:GTP-binding protein Di-Ras2-like [Lepeophtheirus salmonis]XP_040574390.1 GTP-binding protein Di-Ras2-like [Lepeophtheirus salmonis]CAB4069525.1 DIRAS2 [Lepeophtheirus salmonis]CAF3028802.1 DIRAS2 [Lepeophtheirus salmonis]